MNRTPGAPRGVVESGCVRLRHCDLCGALVGSPDAEPDGADVGALCERCLRSRRILPDSARAGAPAPLRRHANKFACPHCRGKLRAKLVAERTDIACPRCGGGLVLAPDGTVEIGPPPWPAAEPRRIGGPGDPAGAAGVMKAALPTSPSELSGAIASDAFEALAEADETAPFPGQER